MWLTGPMSEWFLMRKVVSCSRCGDVICMVLVMQRLVELLEFGWPIGVEPGSIIDVSHCNHQDTKDFPREIEDYFQEIKAGHILSPFKKDHFSVNGIPPH